MNFRELDIQPCYDSGRDDVRGGSTCRFLRNPQDMSGWLDFSHQRLLLLGQWGLAGRLCGHGIAGRSGVAGGWGVWM